MAAWARRRASLSSELSAPAQPAAQGGLDAVPAPLAPAPSNECSDQLELATAPGATVSATIVKNVGIRVPTGTTASAITVSATPSSASTKGVSGNVSKASGTETGEGTTGPPDATTKTTLATAAVTQRTVAMASAAPLGVPPAPPNDLATALATVAAAATRGPGSLSKLIKTLESYERSEHAQGAPTLPDNRIVDDVSGGVSKTERKKDMPKIDGPYPHGRRFRIRVREGGKPAKVFSFVTESDAKAEVRRLRREIAQRHGITIEEAIKSYADHMRKDRGLKERSIETTVYRLTRLFEKAVVEPIATITPSKAKELYASLSGAVDSRMNTLAEAKTFLQFAKTRGMIQVHPLAEVKGEGRRHYGKAKLSRDEARKYLAKCLEMAEHPEQRAEAVAAAIPLVFGLRASEVTERQVRDLDDQGTILRVTRAKSRAGIRSLEVPAWFRPHLQSLAKDKQPSDLLVGHNRSWLRRQVGRICKAAGVPEVPPHGLRGTHSDLALVAASTPLAVSQALGHESVTTTFKHYADENLAVQNEHQRAAAALAPN